MAAPDPVMQRVAEGIELGHGGDREAARRVFADLWAEIGGEDGDPLHRCALAHSMADVQDDVGDELVWDRRALEAADSISDERAAAAGVPSPVAGFYPSLHLNLGECYRRLGDVDRARQHVAAGQAAVADLADDGYGQMITGGLERLAARLAEVDGAADQRSRAAGVFLSGTLVCSNEEQAAVIVRHLPLHISLTRAEPGCRSFDVQRTDDPLVWRVEESFRDPASFRAHQTRVASSQWGRATQEIERRYRIQGLDS